MYPGLDLFFLWLCCRNCEDFCDCNCGSSVFKDLHGLVHHQQHQTGTYIKQIIWESLYYYLLIFIIKSECFGSGGNVEFSLVCLKIFERLLFAVISHICKEETLKTLFKISAVHSGQLITFSLSHDAGDFKIMQNSA